MTTANTWKRFQSHTTNCPGLGITLDTSKMSVTPADLRELQPSLDAAFDAMTKLEAGDTANPDEGRMVGHYWLRDAELAPTPELQQAIQRDLDDVLAFAEDIHKKQITPPQSTRYTELLIIGIGGSALGPQLIADALGSKRDKLRVHFFDNTDPDGLQRTLKTIGNKLKSTLAVVVSKSGGTPETRNGMLEAQAAFKAASLEFAKQAVAVTGEGSKLDQTAQVEGWIKRFPMYDWVGGRTSAMCAVGLLPMALQGLDVKRFLEGARKMDALTRKPSLTTNPAARLAAMWHHATNGRGEKDMVILPYKDRLVLFSKYLQQLVMESLGKELDLDGNTVHQGIAVYGNKGSTDQHAYVQQLRDGINNFFATFIVVLQDETKATGNHKNGLTEVEPGITSGDYLHGFFQGTRQALHEAGRESITLICDKLDARTLGALIALYERAVGLYASMVNINAYHQPGVEAGKKAAAAVLERQQAVVEHLNANAGEVLDAQQIAQGIGQPEEAESIHLIALHLAANGRLTRKGKRFAAKG